MLKREVVGKTTDPTEAEARTFFAENKARIGTAEFAAVKADIVAYLRDQRQRTQAEHFADQLRAAAQIKLSGIPVSPPANESERARVFATVNGKNITSADIEDSLRRVVFATQEQVYALRKSELDLKINDLLLVQEAAKRSTTTKLMLATEVTAKIPTISEEDAQKFYDENKARINGEFAALKHQVMQYLQAKAQTTAEQNFANQLRASAAISVFLKPPVAPIYKIAIDDQPARGNANAKVTLIEFTDFECPACKEANQILDRLFAEYGARIRFVVRDYPLSQHQNAFAAAEAAEAAREQGKFWEYVALLMANQNALEPANLKEYASSLQLDRARFDNALETGKFKDKIERDLRDGTDLGVAATPAFFINGRRVTELSYDELKALIEAALKETSATPAKKP